MTLLRFYKRKLRSLKGAPKGLKSLRGAPKVIGGSLGWSAKDTIFDSINNTSLPFNPLARFFGLLLNKIKGRYF